MASFTVGDEHLLNAGVEEANKLRDEQEERNLEAQGKGKSADKKSDSGQGKDMGRPAPKDDSTARNGGKTGTYEKGDSRGTEPGKSSGFQSDKAKETQKDVPVPDNSGSFR